MGKAQSSNSGHAGERQPLKGGMTAEERAYWYQKGYDDYGAKYHAMLEEKRVREAQEAAEDKNREQEEADAELEAALQAEMAAQSAAGEKAEDDDDDDGGLLILEGEDFPPEPAKQRRKKPVFGGPNGPRNLRELAMLNAQAEAEADAQNLNVPMSGVHSDAPSTGKATYHRAKYTDNSKQNPRERLRKKGNGAVNKMLPMRGLNQNWNHVKSSAVFNHGKSVPKVRRERGDTYSRPAELMWMTDEQYREHLKEEKREGRK